MNKTAIHFLVLTTLFLSSVGFAHASESPTPESKWDFDPDVPVIQRLRPQFAIRIEGSPSPWKLVSNGGKTQQLGLGFEYQPRALQKWGVFSVGFSGGILPLVTSGLTLNLAEMSSFAALWYASGNIRYQLKFLPNQWIVPTVGYHFERVNYRLKASGNGSTTASGPVIGVMGLLNALDPEISAQSFTESGLLRSYLFMELRLLNSVGQVLAYNHQSWVGGIRLEFE